MTPRFVLTLDEDAVALLERGAAGWNLLAEARLAAADMGDQFARLRKAAEDAAGDELITTDLVIPDSQIRYLSLPVGSAADDPAVARTMAEASLEGETPYALEDLAYDWQVTDGMLHVAAVARETLDEAEDFAVDQGFIPVTFHAWPDAGTFPRPVAFGPAQFIEGTEIDAEETPAPSNATGAASTHAAPIVAPAHTGAGFLDDPEAFLGDPPAAAPPGEVLRPDGEPLLEPHSPFSEAEHWTEAAAVEVAGESASSVATGEAGQAEVIDADTCEATAGKIPAEPARQVTEPEGDDLLGSAHSEAPDAADSADAGTETEPPETETPAASPGGAPVPAFVSIRHHTEMETDLPAPPGRVGLASESTPPRLPKVAADEPPASSAADHDPEAAIAPADPHPAPSPRHGERRQEPPVAASAPKTGSAAIGVAIAAASAGAAPATPVLKAPPRPSHSPRKAQPARSPAPPPRSEAEAMTLFGARGATRSFARPLKVGLAFVTALAAGTGIAAMFTFWGGGTDDEVALNQPPQAITAPEIAAPSAPAEVRLEVSPETPDPEAAAEAYAETGIWQRTPDAGFLPREDPLDDLYVASIDPTVANQDAYALQDPETSADPRPGRPSPPRDPDAPVAVDANGLVVPNAAGALSPDGILIFAGKPDIVPPKRPATLDVSTATLGDTAPETLTAEDDPLAAFRPRQRPGGLIEENEKANLGGRTRSELAALRPARRPASSQETAEALDAAQEMADAETLEGQAEAADTETAAAETISPEEAALAADLATATRRAVAGSPIPQLRPANISQIADRARQRAEAEELQLAQEAAAAAAEEERARQVAASAAAQAKQQRAAAAVAEQQAAAAAAQQAAAAAAERERQAAIAAAKQQEAAAKAAAAEAASSRTKGPAVARSERATPTGPTPNAVARRATVANVVPLNKVALIGVFGSSSDRRALVRLPSGRYERVKLGSRLDGGKVVAISQSELLYQKGGRNISLKMPKG